MTREEILAMPAGREMDEAVAEAMGWVTKLAGYYKDEAGTLWKTNPDHIAGTLFRPSLDWSAAGLVVEWLRQQWGNAAVYKKQLEVVAETNADTQQLAICRAALLAARKGK